MCFPVRIAMCSSSEKGKQRLPLSKFEFVIITWERHYFVGGADEGHLAETFPYYGERGR